MKSLINIFTLTPDNTRNNIIAIEYLLTTLPLLNHGAGGLFHIKCVYSIINLIIQSDFDIIKEKCIKLDIQSFY